MKLIKIRAKDRARFQSRVAALEAIATYPLGSDTFQIDHGPDYFRFFDRLGDSLCYGMAEGDRLAAIGSGVIRRIPQKAWYLCDLKVHPDFRGSHLPLKILTGPFLPNYLRCTRGYCISMNPSDGRPNRIVRLLARFRLAPLKLARNLMIYSLDSEAMRRAEPALRGHRGKLSYLSLAGIKDIVLGSTGKPLPLLHVQFGPCAAPDSDGPPTPLVDHTHMFPAPEGDPLIDDLRALGIVPTASASIIHHRMGRSDWKFILTSDI